MKIWIVNILHCNIKQPYMVENFASGRLSLIQNKQIDAIVNCGLSEHEEFKNLNKQLKIQYLWVPIQNSKKDRFGIFNNLKIIIQFAQKFERVLIHCDEGYDTCVCVAVGVLLSRNIRDKKYIVSKQSVKQCLAIISGNYPVARPSRGMLKQVFNYFYCKDQD
eukprot:TRINITY_DN16360_c0_g1_i4.p3 TRINITY_DN16360_c0_g1~~TRINITY_DN16360_c0_g1_i4.p3  ORF type:complete len:163 (+),score=4.09 TRINITY_DN16360_c0_g1_i4:25-513(+)